MNDQSSVVFGFLFVAFVVFITIRGELGVYAGLLLLTPSDVGLASGGTQAGNAATNNTASNASSDAVAMAANLALKAIFAV